MRIQINLKWVIKIIDKEEQILILLKDDPIRFVWQQLGVTSINGRMYKEVFNVSRQDIFDYAKKNGMPKKYSNSMNSSSDGFKFVEEDGKWYCCFRERGMSFDEKEFKNYDEGLVYIINMLLKEYGIDLL